MLRVVDLLHPSSDEPWAGYTQRPPLVAGVYDAMVSLSRYATAHDIKLDIAAQAAVTKVQQRSRQPKVIDGVKTLVSAGHERLLEGPLAGMFATAVSL